jgi:ATP-binding cassette, subfamily F, member 3
LEKFMSSADYVTSPPKDKKFRFRFPVTSRNPETVLESINVGHGYNHANAVENGEEISDDQSLFQNVNFQVSKGSRIGFVGPNGVGKSTLLRLLTGQEEPNYGRVKLSGSLQFNYYAQHQADLLDLEETVLESVMSVASDDVSLVDVRTLLAQFMFKGDAVEKKLRFLSGGEKARIALCRMMLQPANLLLLDEVCFTRVDVCSI